MEPGEGIPICRYVTYVVSGEIPIPSSLKKFHFNLPSNLCVVSLAPLALSALAAVDSVLPYATVLFA